MSRSTKGLADFFPTAPSVLQQKRIKASEDRRRYPSSVTSNSQHSNVPSARPASFDAEGQGPIITKGRPNGEANTMSNSPTHEESECVNGDVTHEVGSASSTSTTSSVFSAARKDVSATHYNGVHNSTNLTPLTNIDSSPRANGMYSPQRRNPYDKHLTARDPPRSPLRGRLEENTEFRREEASTPSSLDSERATSPNRPQARPGKGEVKGYKIIFDPDADKSLKGKEKRNRTAEYKAFGQGVRFTSTNLA